MADVFVSYSRRNRAVALRLVEAIRDMHFDVWIDTQDIAPTTEFMREIESAIEAADHFLFVLSPESAASHVCRQELAHAVRYNKRLLPIVVQDVANDYVPEEVRGLNWIYFREQDPEAPALDQLRFALQLDIDYLHTASRLLVDARHWEQEKEHAGFLLSGMALRQAEAWLARSIGREPRPTSLHLRYIEASQKSVARRRRTLSMWASAGLAILVIVALLAGVSFHISQANQQATQQQAQLALSRQVAGEARQALQEGHLDLALLLATEAHRLSDNIDTRDALATVLTGASQLEAILPLSHGQTVSQLAFSSDGTTLYALAGDGSLLQWNLSTRTATPVPGVSADLDQKGASDIVAAPVGGLIAISTPTSLIVYDSHAHDVLFHRLWRDLPALASQGTQGTANNVTLPDIYFTHDGETLVLVQCGGDGFIGCNQLTVLRLNARQGTLAGPPVSLMPAGKNRLMTWIRVAPNGQRLVYSTCEEESMDTCPNNEVQVFDLRSGRALGNLPASQGNFASNPYYFSADGRTLISLTTPLKRFDVATLQQSGSFASFPNISAPGQAGTLAADLDSLLIPSQGDWFYTLDLAGNAVQWDISTLKPTGIVYQGLNPGSDSNGSVSVSAGAILSDDGTMAASVARTGTGVYLWRLTQRYFDPLSTRLYAGTEHVSGIVPSPDGRLVAVNTSPSDADFTVGTHIVGVADGGLTHEFGASTSAQTLAFSPDGHLVAQTTADGTSIWDTIAGRILNPTLSESGGTGQVIGGAFSRDDHTFSEIFTDASGSERLATWTVDPGSAGASPMSNYPIAYATVPAEPFLDQLQDFVISSDGGDLLALDISHSDSDNSIKMIRILSWPIRESAPVQTWFTLSGQATSDIGAVDFNGEVVVAVSKGASGVRLWRVSDGASLGSGQDAGASTLPLGQPATVDVALSPNGALIAVAASDDALDRSLTIWSVHPLTPVVHLPHIVPWDEPGNHLLMGFTDGASELVYGDGMEPTHVAGENTILMRTLRISDWSSIACRIAGRPLSHAEWAQYVSSKRAYQPVC